MQQREIDILTTILEDYIQTGAPVGSRTVAKKSGLNLSPASIRNTMADLTETGFLAQPHTSSGRVPTLNAFRFYLDQTLRCKPLSQAEQLRIQEKLDLAGLEMGDLLRESSKILSLVSKQVSMVVTPSTLNVRWKEIGFSLVKPSLVLAVLLLDKGLVANKLLSVDPAITGDDLVYFSNYLNQHFAGLTLVEARAQVLKELKTAKRRLRRLYSQALGLAQMTFDSLRDRELYVEGTVNLLDQIEFADTGRMRELLNFLEERSRLLELLDKTISEGGVRITLGGEGSDQNMELGIITSTYGGEQGSPGVVRVIGPLRMDYAKTVPLVDYLAKALTEVLKSRF